MTYQYTNAPVNKDTEARIHEFPEVNDTDVVYLGFDCETSGLLPKPWEDTPDPGLMEIGLVGFNKDFEPVLGFSSPVMDHPGSDPSPRCRSRTSCVQDAHYPAR